MKKSTVFVMICAVTGVLLASCVSVNYKPVPSYLGYPTNGKYKVLGRVTLQSTNRAAYSKLLEQAKSEYPDTDDVVNVAIDQKEQITVTPLASIEVSTYIMSGIAIQFLP